MARANEGNPDPNGAVVVGTAMLMGLFARERTGKGQQMLTTMINSNCYANSYAYAVAYWAGSNVDSGTWVDLYFF